MDLEILIYLVPLDVTSVPSKLMSRRPITCCITCCCSLGILLCEFVFFPDFTVYINKQQIICTGTTVVMIK